MTTLRENVKSFWSRPEGKTGAILLAGGAGALVYGWGKVVPFLVGMMTDTLHLAALVAGAGALLYVAFSPRTHLAFRLLARALTGLLVEIDPIGILRDRLSQMRRQRDEMKARVDEVQGQIGVLERAIEKNRSSAEENLKQASLARRTAQAAASEEEALRRSLQVTVKANRAGRLEKQNMSYGQLLAKLRTVHEFLVRWSASVDAYIEDAEDQVRQAEIERKTIHSAYRAFRAALRAIRGKASEQEIYDAAMEHLADDVGRKLGEMEAFQRDARAFMDDMDVQRGVIGEDALERLDRFEQKVLGPRRQELLGPAPGASGAGSSRGEAAGSYERLFQRGE
jgi:DNA-binding FrmR family transcriptional regulator